MITDNNPTQRRTTRQRTALLELLKGTKTHPTAATLHEWLRKDYPSISLGTVYRNLSLLAELGEVQTLRPVRSSAESGAAVERFDADVSEHYHVMCEHCGKVADAPVKEPGKIARFAERAFAESGWTIKSHRLDFYGICPDCAQGNIAASETMDTTGHRSRKI
jgi:Fe2+ or Zn2+ uptake regulation protein